MQKSLFFVKGCLNRKLKTFLTSNQIIGLRSLYTSAQSINGKSPEAASKPRSFSPLRTGDFSQVIPDFLHPYKTDWFLHKLLKLNIPRSVFDVIEPDLDRFGSKIVNQIQKLHVRCETEPPILQQFDAYGNRIDHIMTSQAWKDQKTVAADEGLISIAYERKFAEFSRVYQMAKLYMYSPSSGLYGCPLAMTDGAAKTIEVVGIPDYLSKAFKNLTSRDPKQFWTSGQWMTEKRGGSDVANGTETVALQQADGSYHLHGYKWFSSATDADTSLALARIVDSSGQTIQGTKGLSMFYIEMKNECNQLNNIQVVKLKNKLGTRQLPTAELLLYGAKAYLVGEAGRGVATISDMLTISRTYNTLTSAALIRRMLSYCTDYSQKRVAFGKQLSHHPLHMKVLADMQLEAMSSALLTFELARLLGLEETNKATDSDKLLLRLLTPVCKLYTAKQVVAAMSEGLECLGGLGYLEDTGFPSMLRDAQVLPIWEGTTNVLSLDVIRAIQKSKGEVLKAYFATCDSVLTKQPQTSPIKNLTYSIKRLKEYAKTEPMLSDIRARGLAFSLARVYAGVLFAKLTTSYPHDKVLGIALKRWCDTDLTPVITTLEKQASCKKLADECWDLVMTSEL